MAVFRVERNKGYTVMSNHHLRNKELSLKAKGLLSQMLSLPEDWDYTLKGLSLINREKIDAIREAIKELERAGYIVRSRERDEKGRLRGADYVIFEQPQPPTPDLPTLENPTLDNPTQEKPTLEKPTLENPTQLNKDTLPLSPMTWQAAHLRHRSRTTPIHSNRAKACKQQKEDFIMAQRTGALVFDERTDRYDIRFDLNTYYGGLHCGECFDVFVRGKWKPTRIEYGDNWYLVGIRAEDLNGLRVRI